LSVYIANQKILKNYIIMRKVFKKSSTGLSAVSIIFTALLFGSGSCQTTDRDIYMYVGGYASEDKPGLYVYSYDVENLRLEEIQRLTGVPNPSFVAVHPSGNFLYAVNEIGNYMGNREGSVTSFRIDPETAELEYLNTKSSEGPGPCFVSILADGSHALIANYSGGSISALPIDPDGTLREATAFFQHEGSGLDQSRQRRPLAHSIYPSVDGSYVFSANLGTDKVMIYKTDQDEVLAENTASPYAATEPGAGPRHLALHPDGRWIYVINELNSTVTRLDFDKNSGVASVMESVSSLPEGWEGDNFTGDIHLHPSGKFLYASNRGHNSIAVFRIENDGRATFLETESVRGEWPRNFSIDPDGIRLFVANQRTGNITIFDIDQNTGTLSFTGKELKVDQPACIKFLVR
jgi:6-phosphogluconolactonase